MLSGLLIGFCDRVRLDQGMWDRARDLNNLDEIYFCLGCMAAASRKRPSWISVMCCGSGAIAVATTSSLNRHSRPQDRQDGSVTDLPDTGTGFGACPPSTVVGVCCSRGQFIASPVQTYLWSQRIQRSPPSLAVHLRHHRHERNH